MHTRGFGIVDTRVIFERQLSVTFFNILPTEMEGIRNESTIYILVLIILNSMIRDILTHLTPQTCWLYPRCNPSAIIGLLLRILTAESILPVNCNTSTNMNGSHYMLRVIKTEIDINIIGTFSIICPSTFAALLVLL